MNKSLHLFLLLALTSSLGLAQKTVLIEKFTNAYCGQCPNASIIIDNLMEQYPNTIRVNHHKPVTWIDNPLTNAESIALWDDLGVNGVPQAMVDRAPINGRLYTTVSNLEQGVADRVSEESIVSLDIEQLAYDGAERMLSFSLSSVFQSQPPVADYRLTVMIVEDYVRGVEQHSYYNDQAGHPLEGLGDIIWNYTHRDVVRKIMDGHWGTEDSFSENIVIGETYSSPYTYQIPSDQNPDHLRVVALVSPYVEGNFLARQILNAREFRLNEYGLRTSVDNVKLDLGFIKSMAPNPADDVIHIEFSEIPESIMILSAEGKVVQEWEPAYRQTDLDTSPFANGHYILIAQYGDKTYGQSFIVNH